MNNTESIFQKSTEPAKYVQGYLTYLTEVIQKMDVNQIANFIQVLETARVSEKKIYFIGNGGSAATSSHFANDLAIGVRAKSKHLQVISLTDNVAVLTAIGNDFGYDFIFSKQLENYLTTNDVVVAISASGNSPNLIEAMKVAKEKKAITVGLTGFDGGKLKEMAQHNVHVPSVKGEYGPVEDLHMIIDHIVGTYFMYKARTEL